MQLGNQAIVISSADGSPMKKPYGYLQLQKPVTSVVDDGWGEGWWSEQFNVWGWDALGNALWIQEVLQGVNYNKLSWVFDRFEGQQIYPNVDEADFTYDALRTPLSLHEFWFDPADGTLHFVLWENGHTAKLWEPTPIKTDMVKAANATLGLFGYGTGDSPKNPYAPSSANFTGLTAGLFLSADMPLVQHVQAQLYTMAEPLVFPMVGGLPFIPSAEGFNYLIDFFTEAGGFNASARLRSPDVT